MTLTQLIRTVAAFAGVAAPALAWAAQQPGHQMGAPQRQPASQTAVAECAQAQPQAMRTIDAANMRLEAARQNNSPPAMRAAVDDLQGALRRLRAQLAACAALQAAAPAEPHAEHALPTMQQTPPAPPGMPAMKPGSTMPPPEAVAPAPPAPAAADPHAGHTMSKPLATPAGAKPGSAKPAATPAADPHAGHTMTAPAKPSTGAPAGKPGAMKSAPATAPRPGAADAHAGHTAGAQPGKVMDPVTGLMVDAATAPKTTYQGQTYYFSSEQARQEFLQNPVKFVKKPKQ